MSVEITVCLSQCVLLTLIGCCALAVSGCAVGHCQSAAAAAWPVRGEAEAGRRGSSSVCDPGAAAALSGLGATLCTRLFVVFLVAMTSVFGFEKHGLDYHKKNTKMSLCHVWI